MTDDVPIIGQVMFWFQVLLFIAGHYVSMRCYVQLRRGQ